MVQYKKEENPERGIAMSTQTSPVTFEAILRSAAELPGVRINRSEFLTETLRPFFSKDLVSRAVAMNPAYAGIDATRLRFLAEASISKETARVTSFSFAAGLPGGLALFGTLPADLIQYFGHILRILQKLIYLYGWQELFDEDGLMDDETANLLTLFAGVMFGVRGAEKAVTQISESAALRSIRQPSNAALTRGILDPVATKVAAALGVKITRDAFAKGVSKTVPLLGGLASGSLTYLTFKPMAQRLQTHLATLKFADALFYTEGCPDVIHVDDFVELD